MQRFIQEKNLALFLKRLLAEQKDMDEERRQVIVTLLAEERTKSGASDPSYPVQCPVESRRAGLRVHWQRGARADRGKKQATKAIEKIVAPLAAQPAGLGLSKSAPTERLMAARAFASAQLSWRQKK